MDRKTTILAVLTVLLIVSTSTSYLRYQQQQHVIASQADLIEQLISASKTETAERTVQLPPYASVPEGANGTNSANASVVAVRSDTRLGVRGMVTVEVKEGTGNVLVNTNPFVEPDTQYSIREAVAVAENFTNMNISNKDIIISFDINGTVIGGPSAGAATTVAVIAAMEGKNVRRDVAVTGTIEEGGYIGQVGGVFDKAIAAEKSNMSLFLVPYGQKSIFYYEPRIEERDIFGFSFTRVYYTPKEIELDEYMEGKMAVEEIATIGEAVAYMIV